MGRILQKFAFYWYFWDLSSLIVSMCKFCRKKRGVLREGFAVLFSKNKCTELFSTYMTPLGLYTGMLISLFFLLIRARHALFSLIRGSLCWYVYGTLSSLWYVRGTVVLFLCTCMVPLVLSGTCVALWFSLLVRASHPDSLCWDLRDILILSVGTCVAPCLSLLAVALHPGSLCWYAHGTPDSLCWYMHRTLSTAAHVRHSRAFKSQCANVVLGFSGARQTVSPARQ